MITRKIKFEIPTFHYDDLEVSEITTYDYAAKHIQAVGVEKGWFDSKSEETFGYKESRRYKVTLR